MLTLALAATLVGFVLLVVGLITGTLWLAVACIVVCLVGLIFLVADIVWSGRRSKPEPDRGGGFGFGTDEDAAVDEAGTHPAGDEAAVDPTSTDDAGSASAQTAHADGPAGSSPPYPGPAGGVPTSTEGERAALWKGVVTPRPSAEDPTSDPDMVDHPTIAPQSHPTVAAPSTAERGYADYLRSVGADDIVSGRTPADVPPPAEAPGQGSAPATPASGTPDPTRTASQPPQATSDADDDREDPSPRRTFDPLDPNWRPPLS
ncbi:hypothetical protein ACWDPV_16685 [Gordonia sp. NPDC003504]